MSDPAWPDISAQIELISVAEAAAALGVTETRVSQYLRDGITKWIHGWKRNGWRTAGKKPVKNAELWQRLDTALAEHKVTWHWVRGHAGHDLNERADELARAAIAELLAASRA